MTERRSLPNERRSYVDDGRSSQHLRCANILPFGSVVPGRRIQCRLGTMSVFSMQGIPS